MKTFAIILGSIVAGLMLGIGSSWATYARSTGLDTLLPPAPETTASLDPAIKNEPRPKVEVAHETFDFGPVERDATVKHLFPFTNTGDRPLVLTNGGTSCMKCTLSDFKKKVVPPGQTAMIPVEYHAAVSSPEFRQEAVVLTNDPLRDRVILTVSGKVVSSFRMVPTELVLSKISVNASKTAEVYLFAYLAESLTIVKHEWSEPSTADHFAVEIKPMPAEQIEEAGAKSGLVVAITVKPGLPLGPIQQTIRLETNLPSIGTVDVPIQGLVSSDISVVGRGWSADHGLLMLGTISAVQGLRRDLVLLVRGPLRHEIQFKAGKISPDWLHVTLGSPVDINGGAVVQIPLTIEVPPQSPSASFLNTTAGRRGEIVLETTHPQAKQFKILVDFVVEK